MSDIESKRDRYKARVERKLERASELAEKHKDAANARYGAFRGIADRIPMGQPILVGHHSERGHRADIKRMDSHMRKMSEHLDSAKLYERKIEAIKNSRLILADDPDAIAKLETKVEGLTQVRDEMKRINKEFKRLGSLDLVECDQRLKDRAQGYMGRAYASEPMPFPTYHIASYTRRIAEANKRAALIERSAHVEGWEHEGFSLSQIDGYWVLKCPFKPDAAARSKLKSYPVSLKWSSYHKSWVRKNTGLGSWWVEQVKIAILDAKEEA